MSRQAYMSLVCTSIRSAGAIGPACSTAMTCRACRGPTTSSKAASAIPVAACCGPRARRASPSARCNAKVPGSSYPGPQQRPSYWGPCVTLHLRTWLRKGSALLRIANGSACRADPFDRPKRNSITCVRGGRRDSLQAQGDFRGIAFFHNRIRHNSGVALEIACGTGRLLVPLLRDGLAVEGLDASAEMLALCRTKAAHVGVTPTLYQQLMQDLDLT